MAVITWKNVSGPDFSDSNRLLVQGGDSLTKAFEGLDKIAQNQREMNIFNQEQDRGEAVQAGKEAIFAGTTSLKDWEGKEFSDFVTGDEDHRVRSELFDYFNQRDDVLREETQANLDISKAEQAIRLADAQDARAEAELKLKKAANGRAAQAHAQNMKVKKNAFDRLLKAQDSEDRFKATQEVLDDQILTDLQNGNTPEQVEENIRKYLNTSKAGKPIIDTDQVEQMISWAKTRTQTLSVLPTSKQKELQLEQQASDVAIDSQGGFDPLDPTRTISSLPVLERTKQTYTDAIVNFKQESENVQNVLKSQGTRQDFFKNEVSSKYQKTASDNFAEADKRVEEKLKKDFHKSIGSDPRLQSMGITPEMLTEYATGFKGEMIPEGFKVQALKALPLTRHMAWFKPDAKTKSGTFSPGLATDVEGNDLGGNATKDYENNLQSAVTKYLIDGLLAKVAETGMGNVDSDIAKLAQIKQAKKEELANTAITAYHLLQGKPKNKDK